MANKGSIKNLNQKKILIVGGAGYIGSHTNKEFSINGYSTVVFDNFSNGHKELVKWGDLIEGNLDNIDEIRSVFRKYSIDAVIHFAAFAYVGESVTDPQKYYINNVSNTLNLLKVMLEFDVKKIIFSSTCATYGNPLYLPIDENHPQNPINPYGATKLMIERIIQDYQKAYGLKFVILRYFNAAGADMDCEIGESHNPEPHLIPRILEIALSNKGSVSVYGNDYDTDDGTCVRDYIHVTDLANAHMCAYKYLVSGGNSDVFNLGTGYGCSVMQVINTVKKITGREISITHCSRREGDPPVLVANASKAMIGLSWRPRFSDFESIIQSAWNWIIKHKRFD